MVTFGHEQGTAMYPAEEAKEADRFSLVSWKEPRGPAIVEIGNVRTTRPKRERCWNLPVCVFGNTNVPVVARAVSAQKSQRQQSRSIR
jgi:hypothetical protein